MFVYLAGPTAYPAELQDIERHVRDSAEFTAFTVYFFRPYGAYNIPSRNKRTERENQRVSHINRVAIAQADVVVANLRTPSIGTCREVEYARSLNIRVLALVDSEADFFKVELHDVSVFLNKTDVIEGLRQLAYKEWNS